MMHWHKMVVFSAYRQAVSNANHEQRREGKSPKSLGVRAQEEQPAAFPEIASLPGLAGGN